MAAHPPGSYCLGDQTLCVSMNMFKKNRTRFIQKLHLNSQFVPKAFVVLKGAVQTYIHSSNTEAVFRQESYFHWCFGVLEPGFYGAIHADSGRSILFIPRKSGHLWHGEPYEPSYYIKKYSVDDCCYIDEMQYYFQSNKASVLYILQGKDYESGNPVIEADFENINMFQINANTIFPILTELRVIKTKDELEVIRYACQVSSEAHKEVMRRIRPGWFEYQAESLFQHHVYTFGGCRFLAYPCKATSGSSSYVLQYGNAEASNMKKIENGDICVFDMGAQYFGYCCAMTSSFPVNGIFSDDQKNIYFAVLKTNKAVQNAMKPGVSWIDMHLLAERVILIELIRLRILLGDVEEMIKSQLAAFFMPHGIGHFVGLDCYDVGGYTSSSPSRRPEEGLKSLLTSRILETGMVITVGPGIYFNMILIDQALRDPKLTKFINEKELRRYIWFGGIRIEDCVAVTRDGIELLTTIPRDLSEIECLMGEGIRLPQATGLLANPQSKKRFEEELKFL